MSNALPLAALPLAYRMFRSRNLINWEPWSFTDEYDHGDDAFRMVFESELERMFGGLNFEVRLFARGQDDDCAFFVVKDGVVEDRVLTAHLTFNQGPGPDLGVNLVCYENLALPCFVDWVSEVVLRDLKEWMDGRDLGELS